MGSNRNRRLQKEISDILKDAHSGITITAPQGGTEFTDLTHFHGQYQMFWNPEHEVKSSYRNYGEATRIGKSTTELELMDAFERHADLFSTLL